MFNSKIISENSKKEIYKVPVNIVDERQQFVITYMRK